jgi:hypothetical protein
MKSTTILLATCLLFFPVLLIAQDSAKKTKPPVRLAIKAGLFGARFQFNNLPDGRKNPEGDDMYYAGIQADIPLNKKLSVASEVLYARSSLNTYIGGLYSDYFSHVFVPVLFKYRIGKVSVMAGPQAEFLLTAKGRYFEKAPEDDPDYNYYFKYGNIKGISYSDFTVSGVVGAEWIFKYRLGIDVRYKFGITNFRSDYRNPDLEPLIAPLSEDIKFNGFQAGLLFRFGKKPKKHA